ncbi:MAG: glutathione peroxidase [Alphaproteobacteria bacterium]|nr:glutathione peroxidase [Alphaproteobacteria bacterium]
MTRVVSFVVAMLVVCFNPVLGSPAMAALTAYEFSFVAIDGTPMPLKQYQGKALLIVNTASFCGYTPQYAGLQALWQRYRDRGLVVIGVPSNDFSEQEPGSAKDIKKFCEANFAIDFPLTEKAVVKGDRAHPFYRWAASVLGVERAPQWNFHKYVVTPDGRLAAAFSTQTPPESPRLTTTIESILPKK